MKITKNMMLGSQWVASQLNISAVMVSPPRAHVRPIITQMGTVYRSTMKRPYMAALKRPLAADPLLFRKKDTVMGTMGKTQGVRSIRKPQRMASRMRLQRPLDSPPADDTVSFPSTLRVVS